MDGKSTEPNGAKEAGMDERIPNLITIIERLFSSIKSDWSDPRWECRNGWEGCSHLRALLGVHDPEPYRYREGRTVDQFIEDHKPEAE